MGITLGILAVLVVVWFVLRNGDSSYESMADEIHKEAEAQTDASLQRRRKKEVKPKTAKQQEAMTKAKFALVDHPNYGSVTWSGLGRKPKLIAQYLEDGGSLEDLRVDQAD
jgi:DNA-binding protein H-NS